MCISIVGWCGMVPSRPACVVMSLLSEHVLSSACAFEFLCMFV